MLLACPEYAQARSDFLQEISSNLKHQLDMATSGDSKLLEILAVNAPADWEAFGRMLARIRQSRRRSKERFERLNTMCVEKAFCTRRKTWRAAGKFVCRHGVMFTKSHKGDCSCLLTDLGAGNWRHAKWMPAISVELRTIIAVPFNIAGFRRLGVLQAELRRNEW